jgi:hypothetical protein
MIFSPGRRVMMSMGRFLLGKLAPVPPIQGAL